MRMKQGLMVFALCLAMTGTTLADGVGYATLENSDMYAIDMSTGVATYVGSMAFNNNNFEGRLGMTFADNELYAVGGENDELWSFTTPPGYYIGDNYESGLGNRAGLAYYDGHLYRMQGDDPGQWGGLIEVDPVTGAVIPNGVGVGEFLVNFGDGTTDNIVMKDGLAYSVDWTATGNTYVFDPLDMTYGGSLTFATQIGNTGHTPGFWAGSDVYNDVWYTMTDDGRVWTHDWADGSATLLFQVTDGGGTPLTGWDGGLAITIPEPGSLFLLSFCALAGLAARRGR